MAFHRKEVESSGQTDGQTADRPSVRPKRRTDGRGQVRQVADRLRTDDLSAYQVADRPSVRSLSAVCPQVSKWDRLSVWHLSWDLSWGC